MARHFELTFISPRRPGQVLPADLPVRFLSPELPDPGATRKTLAFVHPTRPFHGVLYSRREVAQLVRRELARTPYDVVYSHFIYGMIYFRDSSVPVVVDQQNVDRIYWQNKADHSPFPFNVFAGWNTRRTIAYETRWLPRIWAYVSVSDEDREQTRAYAQRTVKHFWVAPNGVDTRRFVPAAESSPAANQTTFGYLGSMDLEMNVEAVQRFCTELLPRIREGLRGIDVRFLVIGSDPSSPIRALAEKTPGMSLSGTVEDVVPWLHKVDVLVSPLRMGAGTKLKVAEAMSCSLPVVGSPMAFAGLPGISGEHYVMADSNDGFVAAACQLARSPNVRAAMGRKARQLARSHLDWEVIGRQLAADIQGALILR